MLHQALDARPEVSFRYIVLAHLNPVHRFVCTRRIAQDVGEVKEALTLCGRQCQFSFRAEIATVAPFLQETSDPKPDAPAATRGDFRPIATSVKFSDYSRFSACTGDSRALASRKV